MVRYRYYAIVLCFGSQKVQKLQSGSHTPLLGEACPSPPLNLCWPPPPPPTNKSWLQPTAKMSKSRHKKMGTIREQKCARAKVRRTVVIHAFSNTSLVMAVKIATTLPSRFVHDDPFYSFCFCLELVHGAERY